MRDQEKVWSWIKLENLIALKYASSFSYDFSQAEKNQILKPKNNFFDL